MGGLDAAKPLILGSAPIPATHPSHNMISDAALGNDTTMSSKLQRSNEAQKIHGYGIDATTEDAIIMRKIAWLRSERVREAWDESGVR